MPVAALPSIHRNGGFLPAEPLAVIVRRDIERAYNTRSSNDAREGAPHPGITILASITRIAERVLRDLAQGRNENVALDTADRYLCATGGHLRDVYPWLYSDEQIEADIAASGRSEIGVETMHRRPCATRKYDGCTCTPKFSVSVYQDGKRKRRTFTRVEDARAWRQEWMVRA